MKHIPLPDGYNLRYRWRHAPNEDGRQHTLIYIIEGPGRRFWIPRDCSHKLCGCVEMLPVPGDVVSSWVQDGYIEEVTPAGVAG